MLVGMADDVDEEDIVPLAAARGTRLDTRHADAVLRERTEQTVERSGRLRVAGRYQQRGLVAAAGAEQLAADHQEARRIVRSILDLRDDDVQAVNLGRRLPRDCRRAI